MRMGAKSVLFGSHQFILHPIMVAIGWRRHYGFWPKGWRTWVAIFAHDLGYLFMGCEDMDGETGKKHPTWGASFCADRFATNLKEYLWWFSFVGGHSRYYAMLMGTEPSPLMVPDKLATALLPRWLYWLLISLSGEHKEYIVYARSKGHKVPSDAWGYSGWLLDHWRRTFDRHPT